MHPQYGRAHKRLRYGNTTMEDAHVVRKLYRAKYKPSLVLKTYLVFITSIYLKLYKQKQKTA